MILSKRFEDIIKKISDDKTVALESNNQQRVEGYKKLLNALKTIEIVLFNGDNIKSDYHNYISRGILCDDFINNGIIYPHYLHGLKILDFFNRDNQKMIHQILNVFDDYYVLSSDIYDDIRICIYSEQYKCNYEKLLMELHYRILIDKIYFLWQTNPQQYNYYIKKFNKIIERYDEKIDFTDFDNYNKISSLILKIFDLVTDSDEYATIFWHMEYLIKKLR